MMNNKKFLIKNKYSVLAVLAVGSIGLYGCAAKSNIPLPFKLSKTIPAHIAVNTVWENTDASGSGDAQTVLAPVLSPNKNQIAVSSASGLINIISSKTGETVWQKKLSNQITSSPAWGGNNIFVGTLSGQLINLNAQSGKIVWRKTLSSSIETPVAYGQIKKKNSFEGIIVAHVHNGEIEALNSQTGQLLWTYQANMPQILLTGDSQPVIINQSVLVGLHNGMLVNLNLHNGHVKWSMPVALPSGNTSVARMVDVVSKPLIINNQVYAVSYQGNLADFNLKSGRVIWRHKLSSYRNLSASNTQIFATATNGSVWAFNQSTGRVDWVQKAFKYRYGSAPVYLQGKVIFTDLQGYAHWLSSKDGSVLARSRPSKVAISGQAGMGSKNSLYFYSVNGKLTCQNAS